MEKVAQQTRTSSVDWFPPAVIFSCTVKRIQDWSRWLGSVTVNNMYRGTVPMIARWIRIDCVCLGPAGSVISYTGYRVAVYVSMLVAMWHSWCLSAVVVDFRAKVFAKSRRLDLWVACSLDLKSVYKFYRVQLLQSKECKLHRGPNWWWIQVLWIIAFCCHVVSVTIGRSGCIRYPLCCTLLGNFRAWSFFARRLAFIGSCFTAGMVTVKYMPIAVLYLLLVLTAFW